MEWFLKTYGSIGFLIIGISLVVHYFVILPFLQARGLVGIGSWLFNFRQGRDLEMYGEICSNENISLLWYNFAKVLYKIFLGWIIGWIIFMLKVIITE